jgi:tetratricopeptide (TPR) repeat protein
MKLTSIFAFPLVLGMAIVVAGCQTEPKVIPPDLSAAESFQRAQDAADNGNHALAIRYYRTFRENNPGNADRDIWALYEIAFNYHQMGKNAVAMTYLNQILQQYQNDTGTLPPAPRILAQDLKDRLSPLVASAPGKPPAADPAAAAPAPGVPAPAAPANPAPVPPTPAQ